MDLLPLLVLPCLALASQSRVAPWVFMWVMAFAIFAGCKWMTYCEAKSRGLTPSRARIWGYLLLWPGMDAARFLGSEDRPAKPAGLEWVFAIVKITVGSILLWGIARLALPAHALLAGWIGMGGVIFILHFGLFHLLSLTWRRIGVMATPVMRNPLRAKLLTEFWGRRWNTAFNELTFRFTFRPLRRLANPSVATLLVFALSGLIHELVISLPADAGYGLPSLYFVIQGLGIVTERSRWGQGIGLGRGLRGGLFTMLVTTGPAFWLFHPPFVKNVILPMLNAIGAT